MYTLIAVARMSQFDLFYPGVQYSMNGYLTLAFAFHMECRPKELEQGRNYRSSTGPDWATSYTTQHIGWRLMWAIKEQQYIVSESFPNYDSFGISPLLVSWIGSTAVRPPPRLS